MKSSSARTSDPTTVPPPAGAKDMYSAQTRVGSFPEEVLAAMRAEETDAFLAARTQSGMRRAVRPVMPPPLPKEGLSPETPEPFSAVRPRSERPDVFEPEAVAEYHPSMMAPTQSYVVEEEAASRSSLARSVVIVALFALLGGLVAYAIMQ